MSADDLNRQIFKEEAYDLLHELEGALLELEESPDDMDLVNQIFRALHTIKGSGSMFGFEAIAAFTHEVESVFDMVRNGDVQATPVLCSLALKSRDQIRIMLEADEDDDVPVEPEIAEEILRGLKAFVEGTDEGDQDASVVESAGEPAADGEMQSDVADEVEVKAPLFNYVITLRPLGAEAIDTASVETFFEELERLGELKVLSSHGETGHGWELGLESEAPKDSVQDVFFFLDANLKVEVSEAGVAAVATESVAPQPAAVSSADGDDDMSTIPRIGEILVESGDLTAADVEAALTAQKGRSDKPLGQILTESGKVGPDKISKAVQKQGEVKEQEVHKKREEALTSIRVAADKLDYLVDLVGELVIVQAQITQVVSERHDPALTLLAEELERLSDELRDSTLGIRMLPIGTSFSKFRRLVRDLCANLGKQISLSTSGADTELDKTVIERLGDPLVHLLRNSIDHGIELPEEREAKGKPPQGNIMLSAEHSGGEVLIRITDDGKGMRSDMIREKGIERGLISKDAELTKKELFKLIFEPGFSTATEVTNVSGRGVGMDVVKRAIDSLRGTIDIDSKPDVGTTITIRLPLTLAIIDGLQVQVENEFYVIPLSLVEECVELTRSEVESSDSNQRILHLRGEIVPYIHIRDWFDIEGENPPIEQIVITGVEGSRIGIVVDTVIGEHQTVIKSLGRVYKDVEGISGATIKGDGSIALILDVPGLVRRVVAESK
ncbi:MULTISPECIES: chemotaxis protein CheA [unclassified Pseudodesulfovibrio]|uniref:chemotaxis protein CheA n=1 Tax=unclassified Pseudodesulfovibrio TaxID=2661612 RepID=UPI000FEC0835|nr:MULTISPECIES: chemotaxis protein CheA [unclassified Pseudodesulfovibrio]MCJ2163666.1 chemotaxis protein CheA [Pseudodesulfovibrio sp. S3-i]RWU06075.1 chemotaxis protein CheA [Pseudodesulfovibrio sp. S3]